MSVGSKCRLQDSGGKMKGFIEVNAIRIDNKEIKEFVNVNKIVSISLEKSGRTIINFENSFMRVSESYEEIKQKIKEAQGE